MRVTNTIRNYIYEKVEVKIMPKYESKKAEAERILNMRYDMLERIHNSAKTVLKEILAESKIYTDIFVISERDIETAQVQFDFPIHLTENANEIYKWRVAFRKEVEEKVQNIIVTLELGGNKADLDRMLSEL